MLRTCNDVILGGQFLCKDVLQLICWQDIQVKSVLEGSGLNHHVRSCCAFACSGKNLLWEFSSSLGRKRLWCYFSSLEFSLCFHSPLFFGGVTVYCFGLWPGSNMSILCSMFLKSQISQRCHMQTPDAFDLFICFLVLIQLKPLSRKMSAKKKKISFTCKNMIAIMTICSSAPLLSLLGLFHKWMQVIWKAAPGVCFSHLYVKICAPPPNFSFCSGVFSYTSF